MDGNECTYPPIQMQQYYKLYNNQISMSGVSRAEEIYNSQFQKSKVATNSDQIEQGDAYNVELTVSQANAIMKILPPRYLIQVDRTLKNKRVPKRGALDKRNNKSKKQQQEEIDMNGLAEEPIIQEPIQTINYEQMVRKCQKMLSLLKKNKNSWPFKEPVDPIAMGIPHYRDIITNPMDLRTIQQNLISQKYQTLSQFYADIQLIINNSYTFNKNNMLFHTITTQFEKYFEKIKSEPLITNSISLPPMKKASSQNSTAPMGVARQKSEIRPTIEIQQRKQIATKLKQLPKQQLFQLIAKITEGEINNQLNLQTLSNEKVKYLQEYLSKKQSSSNIQSNKSKQQFKKVAEDDESSFQSDSDS